jgi:hypothetical protein
VRREESWAVSGGSGLVEHGECALACARVGFGGQQQLKEQPGLQTVE